MGSCTLSLYNIAPESEWCSRYLFNYTIIHKYKNRFIFTSKSRDVALISQKLFLSVSTLITKQYHVHIFISTLLHLVFNSFIWYLTNILRLKGSYNPDIKVSGSVSDCLIVCITVYRRILLTAELIWFSFTV